MKTLDQRSRKRTARGELKVLELELDKLYARMRERALDEWSLQRGKEEDPADARVSVRITAINKPVPQSVAKKKPADRLLLPRRTKPWRTIA